MIFFGTQPTFTQVPPRRPDSMSTARAPYSAARWAAASPPLPPPITTRSHCSAMGPCYPSRPRAACGRCARAPPSLRSPGKCPLEWPPMDNPLLGEAPLPPFVEIRPEHVEPAVREILARNRARLDELAALDQPTFRTDRKS